MSKTTVTRRRALRTGTLTAIMVGLLGATTAPAPVIRLLFDHIMSVSSGNPGACCTPAERELIRHAIEHGELHRMSEILAIVRRTGALDATRSAAQQEADRAREMLTPLPASAAREALLELCARAVHRSS